MIGVPGLLALRGERRANASWIAVFLLYSIMIGFRFRVGMDWNNYVAIYAGTKDQSPLQLLIQREPAFKLLIWSANQLGAGLILVNVVSAVVFCWGYFSFAKRCCEPFLALIAGTPLLVVAFAMSGTRQAIAMGFIFYLFATWDKRTTISRVLIVLVASLFHFSSIFVLIFVALATNFSLIPRLFGTAVLAAAIGFVIYLAPESMAAYSNTYVPGGRFETNAPGAIFQVGILAMAAVFYILFYKRWLERIGADRLVFNLALATIAAIPLVYVSSVGAYRFALYFWPMGMYVWSGFPRLIDRSEARALYRLAAVVSFAVLLWGWLTFANNSMAWLPYRNWLLESHDVLLPRPFRGFH